MPDKDPRKMRDANTSLQTIPSLVAALTSHPALPRQGQREQTEDPTLTQPVPAVLPAQLGLAVHPYTSKGEEGSVC